ncbi:MAG: hypothetical protein HQL67_09880 [Magnetococcales bacterium]|nr:hypothetical protein [Magnetococcales bacterium]
MKRNHTIPVIEVVMSLGILYLIALVGWRLYQEVSVESSLTPSISRTVKGAPAGMYDYQTPQLSPKEYRRIIDLEREVATLSAKQKAQQAYAEQVIDLAKDVAIISANQLVQNEKIESLVDLEKEFATLSANQSAQNHSLDRLRELEKGIALLTANESMQKNYAKRLTEVGRRVALVERLLQDKSDQPVLPAIEVRPNNRNTANLDQQEMGKNSTVHSSDRPLQVDDGGVAVKKTGFFIPVGCFVYNDYAQKLTQRLQGWQFPYYRKNILSDSRHFNCVFVGPIPTMDAAGRVLRTLQEGGISKAVAVIAYQSK